MGHRVDRGATLGPMRAHLHQRDHQSTDHHKGEQMVHRRRATLSLPADHPPTTAPTWRDSSMISTPSTNSSTAGTITNATTS